MNPNIKKQHLNQLGAAALAAICFFHTGCQRKSDSTGKQPSKPAETHAAATIDLSGYQNRGSGVVVPNPPIVNSQFDEGNKGWTLPQAVEVKSREGLNQTGALFMEVTDPGLQAMVRQKVPLRPNTTYRFSVQIKTEDCKELKAKDASTNELSQDFWTGASICVEFTKDGEHAGGSYHVEGVHGTSNWTRSEGTLVVPD